MFWRNQSRLLLGQNRIEQIPVHLYHCIMAHQLHHHRLMPHTRMYQDFHLFHNRLCKSNYCCYQRLNEYCVYHLCHLFLLRNRHSSIAILQVFVSICSVSSNLDTFTRNICNQCFHIRCFRITIFVHVNNFCNYC